MAANGDFDLEFQFYKKCLPLEIAISNYVLCSYDDMSWIGIVCEMDFDNEDTK